MSQHLPDFQEYVGNRSNNGERHGKGKALLPNRDQYSGEYRDGKRHGSGIYQFKGGSRYEGDWKEGAKHGKGEFLYPDGSSYYGKWKQNRKHGFGKYRYANGDIYEGTWRDDQKHGVGTYKSQEAGLMVKATWVDGAPKGPIEIFYPDCRYHGYWNQSGPIGVGAFTFGTTYMETGHVQMVPNPDFKSTEKSPEVPADPRCVPRFVAQAIQLYDYSKLPQQPMPLPQTDSAASICAQSSSSETSIKSPVLTSAFDGADREVQEDEEVQDEIQEE